MSATSRLRALGLALLGVAALGVATPFVPSVEAADGNVVRLKPGTRTLRLGVDKSLVVELDRAAGDVLVSNPAIADAVLRTSTRLYLLGVKIGQANIFLFDQAGQEIANFDVVVDSDYSDVNRLLAEAITSGRVWAEGMNGNVVIRGEVTSASDSAKASQIVAGMLQNSSAGTTQGAAGGGGGGTTEQYRVVNLITITGGEQVMLKVTIAEVRREVSKSLGIDTQAIIEDSVTGLGAAVDPLGLITGKTKSFVSGSAGGVGADLSGTLRIGNSSALRSTIQALESASAFRVLAEPSLTAVSGETADFLAGGRFPYRTCSEDSSTGVTRCTISYEQFGVGLAFTPVVLGPGRISLKLRTEVSEITGFFRLDSISQVPIISTRRAESTVELPSGGAFMMAGLIKDDTRRTATGVPGIMRLPILGTLFSSKDFQKNETELVIIVTPYLAKAAKPGDLKRPDENMVFTGDAQAFFLNRLTKLYGVSKPTATPGFAGNLGFSFD